MRERIRQILEILLRSDSFTPVSAVADEIGAGIRTVFRDIQELEYHLAPHGVLIEKKRSAGIRLSGDVSELGSFGTSARTRLPSLSVAQRQLALFLFLGQASRIVKLNELATLFSVSDSCVSNDLKDLDRFLAEHASRASLVRLKGIGVSLEGNEWDIRMALLRSAMQLIPVQDLIQFLLFDKENSKLEHMMAILGFSIRKEHVLAAIRETEKKIGYRFSWYDLGLLYVYLLIALERHPLVPAESGALFAATPMAIFLSAAEFLWGRAAGTGSGDAGSGIRTEHVWLQGVLSALEPGEVHETNRCHPEVSHIVSKLMAELGNTNYFRYDFDSRLFLILQVNLSSLAYKKIFGLPSRIPAVPSVRTGDELEDALFSILSPALADTFGITVERYELEPVYMAIRSVDDAMPALHPKLRVLVICYEGICLAQFISSTIRSYFPDVTIVATLSCDRATDEYLSDKGIDLVITTFPGGLAAAPEFIVSSPFEASSFRKEIGEVFSRFKCMPKKGFDTEAGEEDTGIDMAISLLQRFTLMTVSSPVPAEDVTELLAGQVTDDAGAQARLKKDFDAREELGPVVLEQSLIRLFHCRSKAVSEPVAGAVRVDATRETWVYLVAPDPASGDAIAALSKISVALMEDRGFVHALVNAGEREIKRHLFGFLASTL